MGNCSAALHPSLFRVRERSSIQALNPSDLMSSTLQLILSIERFLQEKFWPLKWMLLLAAYFAVVGVWMVGLDIFVSPKNEMDKAVRRQAEEMYDDPVLDTSFVAEKQREAAKMAGEA